MRCPPLSLLSTDRSSPITSIETSPSRSSMMRCFQPNRENILVYDFARSFAKSLASSPPSAERISRIRFMICSFNCVARLTGFEPASITFGGLCFIQLSYNRMRYLHQDLRLLFFLGAGFKNFLQTSVALCRPFTVTNSATTPFTKCRHSYMSSEISSTLMS